MPIYHVTPSDVLFFRDGRPMASSGGSGHGARWPEASLWFDAVHAALYRAFPEVEDEWEHRHRFGRSGRYDHNRRDQRFGSLTTIGPFPIKKDEWLFPGPADLSREGSVFLAPIKPDSRAGSDLPPPLKYALGSLGLPSKGGSAEWIGKSGLEQYLNLGRIDEHCMCNSSNLFTGEWRTGIGIDRETGAQDGKSIYSAEYLRLERDVHMGCGAWLPLKAVHGDEGMRRLLASGNIVIMGGQQRMCSLAEVDAGPGSVMPVAPEIEGVRVRWVLLSPAVFPEIRNHPGGWLPSWVDASDGRVKLTAGPGTNKARRRGAEPGGEIGARLVAARVPKPVPLSGWTERLHEMRVTEGRDGTLKGGATRTILAVPAGAVYYFEADGEAEARALAEALNWHGKTEGTEVRNRRSTWMGEKGFGLGVCGNWEWFDDVAGRLGDGKTAREGAE